MSYKIRFINHSSFSIENDDSLLLMDPWYEGRVFNNSWSLISDTDLSTIEGINKLSDIIISHEHPDHLHWPTLKKIKTALPDNDITIHMPLRHNSNVKNNIEKMGYSFEYIHDKTVKYIHSDLTVCPFPHGHDAAIAFDIDGKILLNQNDAYLSTDECSDISNMYPRIDAWWMQFSLAGYYANKKDKQALWDKGHVYHLNRFKSYQDIFKPGTSIPYASFCYFCKYYNSYINDVAVTPQHIVDYVDLPVQVLHYNQEMLWTHDQEHTDEALDLWKHSYDNDRVIDDIPLRVSKDDIIQAGTDLMISIQQPYGPQAYFLLYDYPDEAVHVSFYSKTIQFVDRASVDYSAIAGITSSEEFCSFLKFPWGADTLNITGAFEKINPNLWGAMLGYRNDLYVR